VNAIDDAETQLRGRRQTFRLDERLGRIVKAQQIGERPTDVDRDDDQAAAVPGWKPLRPQKGSA
jgi:hypothetical protein